MAEDLDLEQLRFIRKEIAEVKDSVRFLDQRMAAFEQHLTALMTLLPGYTDRFTSIERRLERVERRLEIVD